MDCNGVGQPKFRVRQQQGSPRRPVTRRENGRGTSVSTAAPLLRRAPGPQVLPEPDASGAPRVRLSLPGLQSGAAPLGLLQESSVPAYDRPLPRPSSRTKTQETPARLPGRQLPRRPRRPHRRRGRGCRRGGAGGRGRAAPTKSRREAGRPAC